MNCIEFVAFSLFASVSLSVAAQGDVYIPGADSEVREGTNPSGGPDFDFDPGGDFHPETHDFDSTEADAPDVDVDVDAPDVDVDVDVDVDD